MIHAHNNLLTSNSKSRNVPRGGSLPLTILLREQLQQNWAKSDRGIQQHFKMLTFFFFFSILKKISVSQQNLNFMLRKAEIFSQKNQPPSLMKVKNCSGSKSTKYHQYLRIFIFNYNHVCNLFINFNSLIFDAHG